MSWFVYVLRCSDDNLYIGCTRDIHERMKRHQAGGVPATKERLPMKLISYTVFGDKYKAFAFEKYLKSGSGRAFTKRHFI